jgi:glycosyltransferase involved in cell wall biosynthesis
MIFFISSNIPAEFLEGVMNILVTSNHRNAFNPKDGLLVPPKDQEVLAEAVIKLLKDDDLRKPMEENAYKKAEELSWDNIAKRHIEVYEEVLDEFAHNRK